MLHGCIFADAVFEEQKEPVIPLQIQSEQAVSKYIKDNSDGRKYNSYGYTEIIIHKPKEIVELESLEKRKRDQTSKNEELDSLIVKQKKYIQVNRIERTIEIEHFFTLKDSLGNLQVFESVFILNDTIGVKSIQPKITLPLAGDYEKTLNYYFYEYTIFHSSTYDDSKRISKEFYQFFKAKLETFEEVGAKSNFLRHTLYLCHEVMERGAFDQQLILEEMTKNYLLTNQREVQNYEEIAFSPLYQSEKKGFESESGYYFFHKFSGTYQSVTDTHVVWIGFTPYYELESILQVDKNEKIDFKTK